MSLFDSWWSLGRSGSKSRSQKRVVLRTEQLESRRMMTFNPTALEQEALELVNRVRMDPQGELDHLFLSNTIGNPNYFVSPDAGVNAATDFFNTSATAFYSQWSTLTPTTPVAWNEALYDAAAGHSQAMIDANEQSHQLPGEPSLLQRAENAGYDWTGSVSVGENVYAFQENNFHGHSAFLIDWGTGPSGIQSPPGHRDNIMDSDWQEVGIAILFSTPVGSSDVGPEIITQDFGQRGNFGNPMILGVAFTDADGDLFYDAGEGLGGVTITATNGTNTFTTTTMTAGGYQMAVPNGTYNVTASGGGLPGALLLGTTVVSGSNTKLDLESGSASPAGGLLTGTVYNDNDENGSQAASGEPGQSGWTVYADSNGNGQLDSGEATATTDSNGDYELFTNSAGTFTVRTDNEYGFRLSPAGATSHTATVAIGQTVTGLDFARFQDVKLSGSTVEVFGTANADTITYTAATGHVINVNGLTYSVAPAVYDTLNIYGRNADDTLVITANDGNDDVVIDPGDLNLTGVTTAANGTDFNYTLRALSFNDVDVDLGGGVNDAEMNDGGNDDDLFAHPTTVRMKSATYDHFVENFDELYAFANTGGNDRAYLYDGTTDDHYIGRKEFSVLKGANDEFFVRMEGFERNFAYSENGGTDYAFFYDTPGDENFFGRPEYALMQDPSVSFFNYASGFTRAFAYATQGGFDQAFLTASTGDDRYFGKENLASLRGANFEYFNQAEQFERTFAYGGQGGNDVASYFGSAGDDRYFSYPTSSIWRGPADQFYHTVNNFEDNVVYASEGGTDRAFLYDGTGNDLFFGRDDDSFLSRTGYINRLINVEHIQINGFNGPTNTLNTDSLDYVLSINGTWV